MFKFCWDAVNAQERDSEADASVYAAQL